MTPPRPTPAQQEETWNRRPTTPPPRQAPSRSPDPHWTEPGPRARPQEAEHAEVDPSKRLQFEEDGKAWPTEREAKNLAAKDPATKQKRQLKVTGGLADWSTLSSQRSHDPTMNMCYTLHARLVTHKWKVFLLMLRGRQAQQAESRVWKRPVRWLGMILGTEVSKIFGHLGVASRELKAQKAAELFK